MQELPHQSLRASGRETEATASPLQKATKLPHAKLLCPLCLCLSRSVSLSPPPPPLLHPLLSSPPLPRPLHCLRWLGALALLRLWHWLRTSALSRSLDARLETWPCERRWLASVKTAVNVRKDAVYVLLFVRRWWRQSTVLKRARRLTSAVAASVPFQVPVLSCLQFSLCISSAIWFS